MIFCCWPFLSTFLPLPFSALSSHDPPILAVAFIVFCNLLVSLSQLFSVISRLSIILPMCPAHFIRLFNYCADCVSLSSNFFSFSFHSPSLQSLYIDFSPNPVVLDFSHTCSLRCCYSDLGYCLQATSTSWYYTVQEFRTFPFSYIIS